MMSDMMKSDDERVLAMKKLLFLKMQPWLVAEKVVKILITVLVLILAHYALTIISRVLIFV